MDKKRKKLLPALLIGLIVVGVVTIALVDRDKRLTFRLAQMRLDREHYIRYLVEHYYKGTDRVKRRVLLLFDRMDPNPFADFIEIAKDNDPALQAAAVVLLIEGGKDKIGQLIEVFDDDPVVQAHVAKALIQAGAEVVPALQAAALTSNPPVQWWAITTLRNMGPVASTAGKNLIDIASNNANMSVRVAATEALGAMGDASAVYVPNLLKNLEHDDAELRASTARALGMIGSSAPETLPYLTFALCDDDAIVRENAWVAIQQIQSASPGLPRR